MQVLVSNLQEAVAYDAAMEALIVSVISQALQLEGKEDTAKELEVSVALVDNDYIQELNRVYRDKDRPTDVLSFAMNETSEEEPEWSADVEDIEVLGDIIISLETAVAQAAEYGHSVEREIAFLSVHGILHLLGYDHEEEAERKIMRAREEEILSQLQLTR